MKKTAAVMLAFAMLATTGCSFSDLFKSDNDNTRPYGYKTAEAYANGWNGPCEEIGMKTVQGVDKDIEIHYMKDKEYGFEYQVEVIYYEYSTSPKPQPYFYCEDFDYYYLQEFLKEADFSKIEEKYELTIEVKELEPAYTEGIYMTYIPSIDFTTELQLSDEDINEIMTTAYDALQDFDSEREHYTRSEYCESVYLHVYCTPTEEQAANGIVRGGNYGRYGYKYEE